MDYKAKYEEALERARALHDEAIDKGYALDYVKDYETIFPELAESEEEKEKKIIGYIRYLLFEHACENGGVDVNGDYCKDEYERADAFLKSLRPQPKWKPTEEQMNELHYTLTPGQYYDCDVLQGLYADLKKLMEE